MSLVMDMHNRVDSIDNCSTRACCPLRDICGESKSRNTKPLLPMNSSVEKGELLWTNLHYENCVHLIQSGAYISIGHTKGGEDVPFALFGKGFALGLAELYAPEETTRNYHARCIVPGTVCTVSSEMLKQRIESVPNPFVQEMLCFAFVNQSAAAFAMTRILAGRSLRERVWELLLSLVGIMDYSNKQQATFKLTHEEIASLLSTNRVSVTQVLGKLRDEGAIDIGHESITVKLCEAEILREVGEYKTVLAVQDEMPEVFTKRAVPLL